jgi:aminoglycoside phosphotransferase (APT) family kinase protein
MSEARTYSERLGKIGDAQFQAVAERLNLGRFIGAAPIASGLFGQNVFLTTSEGAFVLRGAPHWVKGPGNNTWRPEDRWQFTKERHFARLLHEHTKTPVPWPMLHDESSDIFGWPYLVMPRMPGIAPDKRTIRTALSPDAQRRVAVSLGETLAEMQRLTSPVAGDFSVTAIAFEPYAPGPVAWIAREALGIVRDCGERLTPDERRWVEAAAADAPGDAPVTYTHCDYKLGNVTLVQDGGAWRVGGLFDFHEARFADGTLDLVRTACAYLDTDPELAAIFRRAYAGPLDPARMLLYVLNDRLKIWDYATRPGANVNWLEGETSFRRWAQPYADGVLALI